MSTESKPAATTRSRSDSAATRSVGEESEAAARVACAAAASASFGSKSKMTYSPRSRVSTREIRDSEAPSAAARSATKRAPNREASSVERKPNRSCRRTAPATGGFSAGVAVTEDAAERYSHPEMCNGCSLNSQPPGHANCLSTARVPCSVPSTVRQPPRTSCRASLEHHEHVAQRQNEQPHTKSSAAHVASQRGGPGSCGWPRVQPWSFAPPRIRFHASPSPPLALASARG
mmetsp:Transcript_27463/g.83546  ORF Transcript_27463/g.83546 Transcript_27463/m.83546 type:complete len:232 (+) Transcript_27463:2000-2695(+)